MKKTYDELRGIFKFQLREDSIYTEEEVQRIGNALTNAEILEYHQLTPEDIEIPDRQQQLKTRINDQKHIEQERLMAGELTGLQRMAAIMNRNNTEG